jgi:hypothetical protein
MELFADPGLTLFIYTAEPGSESADALGLLDSWAAARAEADRRTISFGGVERFNCGHGRWRNHGPASSESPC